MRFFSILAVIFCLAFASCTPQRAIYNYLEDMKDTTMAKEFYVAEPVIQNNDLLSIQVTSASLDPNVDQLYNMRVMQGGGRTRRANVRLPR